LLAPYRAVYIRTAKVACASIKTVLAATLDVNLESTGGDPRDVQWPTAERSSSQSEDGFAMKRLAGLAIAFVWLTLAAAEARDHYPRSPAVDVIHYRIQLDLTGAGDRISGTTEILFACKEERVKNIALDFGGLVIEEVSENDRATTFAPADGKFLVQLAGNYHRGEQGRIRIKYHGSPQDGLLIKANKFGDRTVFADNWPNRAHDWFPGIDHPYDKATVEFLVTAPARYEVIANGKLVELTANPNGTRLTHWRQSTPIPTYCMVVGAAEFSIIPAGASNGTPLSYYLYPKDRAKGLKDFGRALRMLEFYAGLIGPYPYEKLALVEATTRFGGMENASAIFFDEKAFDGSGKLETTVAHEIAHQWFGDSVTESDWHHLWLSEGFATYFGHLFFERADGRERFIEMMLADKAAYLQTYGGNPRPIYDPQVSDLFALLNANNYQKGGWLLHMLRRLLGDAVFFAGVRDYYRDYRNRNALTEDFQHVLERRAGRRLDWFFNQWFYGAGHPVYDAAWHWEEGVRQLRLRIVQTQPALFQMPVDVEFTRDGAARRETVEVKERQQTFTFTLDRKPQRVAIDPDEWLLKVATLKEE
jgi:aminopeptidase N